MIACAVLMAMPVTAAAWETRKTATAASWAWSPCFFDCSAMMPLRVDALLPTEPNESSHDCWTTSAALISALARASALLTSWT